tara:strand:+ start:193 stop:1170 length:978 start_codon:yes stop_codon:yes gene_type:complete
MPNNFTEDPTQLSYDESGLLFTDYGSYIKVGGEYFTYNPGTRRWRRTESPNNPENYQDISSQYYSESEQAGEVFAGVAPMTQEEWTTMTNQEKAQELLDTKYGGDLPGETDDINVLMALIQEGDPAKREVDQEKLGFAQEQYGGGDISFADSLTGRQAGLTYDAAGLAYDAAGLTKEAADITRAGAQEAYGLGISGAERQKGTMLGGLQESAYQVAPSTSGTGARSKMRGMKGLKKGFEAGMGAHKDVVKGLKGTWEGAQKTHGLAEDRYGLAGEQYDLAGEQYDLKEDTAGLDYRQTKYGLEEEAVSTWEADWKNFYDSLPTGD